MRISDWSSDVCSSDLPEQHVRPERWMKRHFDDQRQCSDDGADDQDQESRRSVTNIELAIVQPATATSRFEPDYMRAKNGLCSTLWTKAEKGRSRSEEHTSELQSLMRISYTVFCLKQK